MISITSKFHDLTVVSHDPENTRLPLTFVHDINPVCPLKECNRAPVFILDKK